MLASAGRMLTVRWTVSVLRQNPLLPYQSRKVKSKRRENTMDEYRLPLVAEAQKSQPPPMMKCGHAAMATCSSKGGVTFSPPIPSCVVCDCIEIAESSPDLAGRMARCDYFGKSGWRDSGPIYGGGECSNLASKGGCRCLVPSNIGLPFFEYLGPGSNCYKAKNGPLEYDGFFCGCAGWN